MLKRYCDKCEKEIPNGNTFALVTVKLSNCPPGQVIYGGDIWLHELHCMECKNLSFKEPTHGKTQG